jgi:hypothetical protein
MLGVAIFFFEKKKKRSVAVWLLCGSLSLRCARFAAVPQFWNWTALIWPYNHLRNFAYHFQ